MENNIKKEIAASQIYFTKAWANGNKYFQLFAKHLPKLVDGKKVLIYGINNLSATAKIIESCGNADFFIVGDHSINMCLKEIGFKFEEVNTSNEYNIPDMKFDCIIMNPPYEKNLHLRILESAIKHLNDSDSICINLSPIPRLASIRNFYDEKTIKRNAATEVYSYLVDVEHIKNGIELFNAGIQQHLGIQTYDTIKKSVDIEKYVESPLPKEIVRKIMIKSMDNSVLKVEQNGTFALPISDIHGHVGAKDFLNIMSLTYEEQLTSAGRIKVMFESEKDRHDFYNFWMSKLGKLIVSLWKVDTNVEHRYIPYAWFNTNDECYKYFNLTDDEKKIIEDTMAQYK